MIPKVINYCWFGKNEKNDFMIKCINSWKKFFPDYEIKEWNEKNFDVNQNKYIQQAYACKKYAFVSDYARLKVIYDNGGIYFDVDIEVLKDFSPIINKGAFLGCEEDGVVNTGVGFAAEKNNEVIGAMLKEYTDIEFIVQNVQDLTPCPYRNTNALKKLGWVNYENKISEIKNVLIYPTEYFCPYNYKNGILNITNNTYSIHHCNASWKKEYEKKLMNRKKRLVSKYGKIGLIIYFIDKFINLIIYDRKELIKKIKGFLWKK